MVTSKKNRSGTEKQFPGKLHDMMSFVENNGLESIIAWELNGYGIRINNPDRLVEILPLFFGQTKYRSFRRQLNMWHFHRILEGPNKGVFVHPYFVKHNREKCSQMSRQIAFKPTLQKEQAYIAMASCIEPDPIKETSTQFMKSVSSMAQDTTTCDMAVRVLEPAYHTALETDPLFMKIESSMGGDCEMPVRVLEPKAKSALEPNPICQTSSLDIKILPMPPQDKTCAGLETVKPQNSSNLYSQIYKNTYLSSLNPDPLPGLPSNPTALDEAISLIGSIFADNQEFQTTSEFTVSSNSCFQNPFQDEEIASFEGKNFFCLDG